MKRAVAILVFLTLFAEPLRASDEGAQNGTDRAFLGRDVLCGVYAAYAAHKKLGGAKSLIEFHRPEFVSSSHGSTIAEVESALGFGGLASRTMRNLTVESLRAIVDHKTPVIVHVRSHPMVRSPDHYVLVVATAGVHVEFIDADEGLRQMSVCRFASLWDGTGIVVNAPEAAIPSRPLSAYFTFGWTLLGIGFILTLAALIRPESWMVQAGILLIGSVVGSLVFHSVGATGMLRCPSAVADVDEWHTSRFLPVVNYDEVRRAAASGAFKVIDARTDTEFQAGHIPTAIHMSAWWPEARLMMALTQIPGEASVIVYCGNEECGASDRIAQLFKRAGYRDVRLYKAGWSEWKRLEGKGGKAP